MPRMLIKYSPNWADECDFPGFTVMTEDDWLDYQEVMRNRTNIEWDFGTNEFREYNNGVDLLREMHAVHITEQEYGTLRQLLLRNGDNFGMSMPDKEGYE